VGDDSSGKLRHWPETTLLYQLIEQHSFWEKCRAYGPSSLILARSRETVMGNIGVMMTSERGSVTGMFEAAGQGVQMLDAPL
jgi:hypothetical protein